MKQLVLAGFVSIICSASVAAERSENQSRIGLSDEELTSIRDGFDSRVAEMFEEQKPLCRGALSSYCNLRAFGWNAVDRGCTGNPDSQG